MIRVVINADDLGISVAVNRAVRRAHASGILTSASLMTNMPAFDHAVSDVIPASPTLGIGVHLILTSGAPVLPPADVPLLVDERGAFRLGFTGILQLVRGHHRDAALDQIAREWRAQCDKARHANLSIDHLDSHRHVHMIPELWPVVVDLAAEYSCPYVRLADEPWPTVWSRRRPSLLLRNAAKKILLSRYARSNRIHLQNVDITPPVRVVDRVAGILESGGMTGGPLGAGLLQSPGDSVEIITHPSVVPAPHEMKDRSDYDILAAEDVRFLLSPNRGFELDALTSPSTARTAANRSAQLMSFRELARTPLAGADPDHEHRARF